MRATSVLLIGAALAGGGGCSTGPTPPFGDRLRPVDVVCADGTVTWRCGSFGYAHR